MMKCGVTQRLFNLPSGPKSGLVLPLPFLGPVTLESFGYGWWEMDSEECRAQEMRVQSIRDRGGCQWLPDALRRQRYCFAQISKDEKKGPGSTCAIQIKLRFPLMWLVTARVQHTLMAGSGKVSKGHGKLQRYLDCVRSRMVFCRKYKRTFPVLHVVTLRWGLIVLISLYFVLALTADSVFIASSLITCLGA